MEGFDFGHYRLQRRSAPLALTRGKEWENASCVSGQRLSEFVEWLGGLKVPHELQ
jgi:hypothetical protein